MNTIIPIKEYLSSKKTYTENETWNEYAAQYNHHVVKNIMSNWNCTEHEAWASIEFNCDTLEDTQNAIARAVTYNRLIVSLLPEAIQYMEEHYFKDKMVSKDFIQSEAGKMVEEQAGVFVYQWGEIDDYNAITELEMEAVIYGKPLGK